ncbi:hypothetical protein EYF80_002197 [Liparis tanakae]|uniref:Uncharacterized protein n=1 Tax=Liparis tanakae TaxID=230148 RepID=A0A4Z2JBG5_9TELE|nr:hypothetical protein EYF80_002197 [Liparis tanakae]
MATSAYESSVSRKSQKATVLPESGCSGVSVPAVHQNGIKRPTDEETDTTPKRRWTRHRGRDGHDTEEEMDTTQRKRWTRHRREDGHDTEEEMDKTLMRRRTRHR